MHRPISISTTIAAPWASVVEALARRGDAVLGEPAGRPRTYVRRLATQASVDGVAVSHPVEVCVHGRHHDADGHRCWWDLDVHAVGRASRFPAFRGVITVGAPGDGVVGLELRGECDLPMGVAGVLADRVLGHRIVQGSLQQFLDEVGEALGAGAAEGPGAVGAPVDQRAAAHEPPDLYLG